MMHFQFAPGGIFFLPAALFLTVYVWVSIKREYIYMRPRRIERGHDPSEFYSAVCTYLVLAGLLIFFSLVDV